METTHVTKTWVIYLLNYIDCNILRSVVNQYNL